MINDFKELLKKFDCHVVIGHSLAGQGEALLKSIEFNNRQLLLVCDSSTYEASGKKLAGELHIPLLVLEGKPSATMETVAIIRAKQAEGLIAVGSGTINDLCKYASFLDGKPYAVFPSAPSMNGYCSANASITVHGHKQTFGAHLPKGVFCDLAVLAAAPPRLIRSGLGDSLCRPTAQADWLLSHLLFNTPYDPLPFSLLAPYERELFEHAGKLVSGDIKIIELLTSTLLASGFGMTIAGGSYPASQGEHLIAHTMEMKHANALPETYHGEQIGVTTLIMADIQQRVLSEKLHLRLPPDPHKAIKSYFGAKLRESVMEAYAAKREFYEQYDKANERLQKEGALIRDAINRVILPESVLRMVLEKAHAPVSALDLGWNSRNVELAVKHAKFIRNRFTFLDLV